MLEKPYNATLEKYNKPDHFKIWDDFVLNRSFNGTIFHTQKFMVLSEIIWSLKIVIEFFRITCVF